MKKTGHIYGYEFPNGKWYVGQSFRPVGQRDREHRKIARRKKCERLFYLACRRFGKPPLQVLVDGITTRRELNRLEKHWIKELSAFTDGYNMNEGGAGGRGYKHTPEMKAYLRDVANEVWKRLKKEGYKREPLTAEQKENISKGKTGIPKKKSAIKKFQEWHKNLTPKQKKEQAAKIKAGWARLKKEGYKRKPFTEEHKAALSKSRTGVPKPRKKKARAE